jgi:hypothetical protein
MQQQQAVVQACWTMLKPFLAGSPGPGSGPGFEKYLSATQVHVFTGDSLWDSVLDQPLRVLAVFHEDRNVVHVVHLKAFLDALHAAAMGRPRGVPILPSLEAIFTFLATHTVDVAVATVIVLVHELVHVWQHYHRGFLGLDEAPAQQAACVAEGHATHVATRVASLYGMTLENQLGLLFMRFKATTPVRLEQFPPPTQCYYQAQDDALFREWMSSGKVPLVVVHDAKHVGLVPATGLDKHTVQKLGNWLRNPSLDKVRFWSTVMRAHRNRGMAAPLGEYLEALQARLRLELQGEVSAQHRLSDTFAEFLDASGRLRRLVERQDKRSAGPPRRRLP